MPKKLNETLCFRYDTNREEVSKFLYAIIKTVEMINDIRPDVIFNDS